MKNAGLAMQGRREWYFSLMGGREQGEEHWGELELKLEKQNRVSSWRDVNSRLRILDFIMLNTVNPHYLWVLYLWICLLTETCHPQNQFLYTQCFFSHNGICTGLGGTKNLGYLMCMFPVEAEPNTLSSCFSSQTVVLFTGHLVSFFHIFLLFCRWFHCLKWFQE